MKAFPMFIKTTGRRVVVVGGEAEAAQKTRLVLKTNAEIELIAPELDAELSGLVQKGRARHINGQVTPAHFEDTALTFVATGCPGADAAFHHLAKKGGALVNVVDRPELCDATTPSIVDRDPVVVAIGTEGTAPVLSRRVKTEIEAILPTRLGALAALAGRLRDAVSGAYVGRERRAFWAWVFGGAPAQLHRDGQEDEAARMIKRAIAEKRLPKGEKQGHIALVGAGPGARDLLTFRAVERLQEADVIFYDRLVDPDVLELARRDAERVYVGKTVGASSWPQEKICSLIVSEAKKGRRVVRLKSGDPGVFGRTEEEVCAAQSADIAIEIVPGVTAASAAAAAMTVGLTERGETDTLVFTTGKCKPGCPPPDWAHHVRAGTTLAVYMGVGSAQDCVDALMAAGADPLTSVDIGVEVSLPSERFLSCDLLNLPKCLGDADVKGQAMIIIRFPKEQAAAAAIAAE